MCKVLRYKFSKFVTKIRRENSHETGPSTVLTSSLAHENRFKKHHDRKQSQQSGRAWHYTLHLTYILVARDTFSSEMKK